MNSSKSAFETFRQKTHILIYGTRTFGGKLFDFVLLGLILFSVLLVMLETVSGFNLKYHDQLVIIEWIITILFTIEYFLRIISINKPFKYIFSFYGIIDFIAVVPMYLSFFFVGTSVLSIIRAVRLLRLFKILNHPKFNSQSIHLRDAIISSRGKIVVFLYFILVSTIIIGSIMYVVEGPKNGFTSIPIGIYWAIVTLTTVGYGDISPLTPLGQFIASFVMILGYGIIAVPTGIVTAEMVKSKPKNIDNKNITHCFECGSDDHLSNANFCQKCGHKLNE